MRLIFYTGSGPFKLARLYNEYSINCVAGDAFSFEKDQWYAIALEVDGKVRPFTKHERLSMKVRVFFCCCVSLHRRSCRGAAKIVISFWTPVAGRRPSTAYRNKTKA